MPGVSLARASVADATWIGGESYATEFLRFASNGGPAALPDPVVFWSDPRNWSGGAVPIGDARSVLVGLPLVAGDVDRLSAVKVQTDLPSSLSLLAFDNPRGVTLLDTFPTANAFIWSPTVGLNIESRRVRPMPASGAMLGLWGDAIQIPIFGPNPVTVRGPGVLTLTRSNGFSGELRLAGGALVASEQAGGVLDDSRFGVGPRIVFDGGALRLQRGSGSTNPRVLTRPIHVADGGATVSITGGSAGVAWTGPVDGSGNFRLERGRLELRVDNPFAGPLRVDASATLAVSGQLGAVTDARIAGTLELNHGSTLLNADRISDSATIRLHGGALSLGGGTITTYDETIGGIDVHDGAATISITPPVGLTGPTPPVTLRIGQMTRASRSGGAFFRGDGLGTASGAAPRILIGNAASLLSGAGGPVGSTRQSVIPFAWGARGADVAALSGAGSGSFVTHDPTTGVRPLDLVSEYRQSFVGSTAQDNVRITGQHNLGPSGVTINALLLSSIDGTPTGAPPTIVGGTITVASGAILNTVVGSIVHNAVDFGDREGVILAVSKPQSNGGSNRGIAFWGPIHGSGGLTRLGHGNVFLGGENTYTGPTALTGGRTSIVSDVLVDVPGPFGSSNQPITLVAGGTTPTGVQPTMLLNERVGQDLIIARPVRVEGMTSAAGGNGLAGGVLIGGVVNGSVVRLTGPVDLASPDVTLGASGGTLRIEGPLTGAGGVRVLGGSTLAFGRSNPGFSGEVEIGVDGAGAAVIEADDALGTGRVFLAGSARMIATGGSRRIGNDVAFAWSESNAGVAVTPVRFDGHLEISGAVDLGGNVGRAVTLPAGASLKLSGSASGGSFRLLSDTATSAGGTLTLAGANTFDARVIVGAPHDYLSSGVPAMPGGVLRIVHDDALGAAGAQIDADKGSIQLDGGIRLRGGGNLFIRGEGTAGAGALDSASGENRLDGSVALLDSATVRVVAGSSLTVLGDLADQTAPRTQPGTATLVKTGDGTLRVPRLARFDLASGTYTPAGAGALSEVWIDAGAIVIEDRPGFNRADQVSVVRSLSIGPTGRLDLGDSAMVIDHELSPAEAIAPIRNQLASGRNGGGWDGFGIVTSSPIAGAGIAYLHTSQWFTPGTVFGRPVDSTSVVLAFALMGDANVDGKVDLGDYASLAAGFNHPGTWRDGDFNYDGVVGIADFSAMAANFNRSLVDAGARGSAIPEPSLLGLLGCVLLTVRRRV